MHLPLLISKANWIKLKMFQNDYKIGYRLKMIINVIGLHGEVVKI